MNYEVLKNEANLHLINSLYKKHSFCRKDIQYIINTFSEYFKSGLFKKIVEDTVKSNGTTDDDSVLAILDIFENPFHDISTEHKRFQMLQRNSLYTPTTSHTIGSRLDYLRHNGAMTMQNISVKYKFISLKKSVQSFLENESVFAHVMDYLNILDREKDTICNVMQTSFWKNICSNYKSDSIVLPLLVYYDDFEVNNPLGSRTGYQKLGAVYVSFPFISEEYRSRLDNIFVTLLFNTLDKKKYGNSIFSLLIDDLKDLEANPVNILGKQVFFVLVSCIGDNLGLNSMLGFTESFSANYFCRICRMHKNETKTATKENVLILRNPYNYENDLKMSDPKRTGIISLCVFNELRNFHVSKNFSVDLLHDLYEGFCNFEVAFILLYFIQKKIFDIKILNNRITGFYYGEFENVNRPQEIAIENLKNHKLRYSASELMWFIKYLGLIIGDLIPECDVMWKIFLTLREIIDLLFLERICEDNVAQLEKLIILHHSLYLQHFKLPLKPKHHFLTHYPSLMRKFGPIKQFWVMRHEAKHKQLKEIANSTRSRRNICHTIAERLQLGFFKRKCDNDFVPFLFLGKEIKSYSENLDVGILENLKCISNNIKFVNWVEVSKFKIKSGMVVAYDNEDDLPSFGLIQSFAVLPNEICFCICQLLKTIFFDNHRYAFAVDKTDIQKSIELNLSMLSFHTINKCKSTFYVTGY